MQAVAPDTDVEPAAQLAHDAAPTELWYLPGMQLAQVGLPMTLACEPTGQLVQAEAAAME